MSQYYAIANNQQVGPMDESALVAGFLNGTYPPDTLVWKDGMSGWQNIGTLPCVVAAQASLPPRPAPAPTCTKRTWGVSKKQRTILTWILVLAVVVGIAIYFYLPKSFKTDDDVKDYLDKKVEVMMEADSKAAKLYKKALPLMKKGLKDTKEAERFQPILAGFMAACDEPGAMKYFFEKKGFDDTSADAAFCVAAWCGNIDVMKYLWKKHLLSDEENVAQLAFVAAAVGGAA